MNHIESEVNSQGYIDNKGQPIKESIFVRFRRPIAAAAASIMMASGIGAMAEPTSTSSETIGAISSEDSLNGVETPEQVLQSKGIGDVLANADNGPVTNVDIGVEVSTDENDQPMIETLSGRSKTEAEKTSEEILIENCVSFLNNESPNTDSDIVNGLMTLTSSEEKMAGISVGEDIKDIGRIYTRNVQGRLLGYLETSDKKNLLIFLGTKDCDGERFVTAVRVPLYVMEDNSTTFRFTINSIPDLLYTRSKGSSAQIKDSNPLIGVLESELNDNIIVNLYTDEITKSDLKDAKKVGTVMLEYANDMKKSVFCARSLDADVFDNGIKLEYPDPGMGLWSISNAESVDTRLFKRLTDGSVENVPIILGLTYSSGD